MEGNILIAVIGICGVLIGAIAQYFLTKRSEKNIHFQQLRTASYVDFVNFTSQVAIYQSNEKHDQMIDALAKLTEAKSRIAIYGSPSVAKAVADFFREHGALTSAASHASYTAILSTMRAETLVGGLAVDNETLSRLVIGNGVD